MAKLPLGTKIQVCLDSDLTVKLEEYMETYHYNSMSMTIREIIRKELEREYNDKRMLDAMFNDGRL